MGFRSSKKSSKKKGEVINVELEVLIHPKLELKITELALLYRTDKESSFDDYYANKLNPKKWNIKMYDIPMNVRMEFYLRFTMNDGSIILGKKDGKNYAIQPRDNADGEYKAQIRITEDRLMEVGRKCLVCEELLRKGTNICEKCSATFCPSCTRMLPPGSNYCPWDDIRI